MIQNNIKRKSTER